MNEWQSMDRFDEMINQSESASAWLGKAPRVLAAGIDKVCWCWNLRQVLLFLCLGLKQTSAHKFHRLRKFWVADSISIMLNWIRHYSSRIYLPILLSFGRRRNKVMDSWLFRNLRNREVKGWRRRDDGDWFNRASIDERIDDYANI